jgi:hypothetical protein
MVLLYRSPVPVVRRTGGWGSAPCGAPALFMYFWWGGGGGHYRPREVVPADRPPRSVGGSRLGIRSGSRQAKIVSKKGKMKPWSGSGSGFSNSLDPDSDSVHPDPNTGGGGGGLLVLTS